MERNASISGRISSGTRRTSCSASASESRPAGAGPILLALLILSAVPAAATVAVEFGRAGETVRRVVATPNLAASPPSDWAFSAFPLAPPPAGTPPAAPPPEPPLRERFPHLFARATGAGTSPRGAPVPLNRLIAAPAAAIGAPRTVGVTGPGKRVATVVAEGRVTIRPSLRTYRPASMVVRLLDAAGAEVRYGGEPLFAWTRRDDREFSPLKFKGAPDDRSMRLVKAGDFSPADGLSYTVDVVRGQKIVVEQTGSPEPDSTLSVEGQVF